MAGDWRPAKSIIALRDQVDALFPLRSKSDDGIIGDEAHASRVSDHNPNSHGVVQAIDLTHDPAHGFDSYKLAETLKANKDKRIKYIISNHRISNPNIQNWEWRNYNGSDPHTGHIHISVSDNPLLYDDDTQWNLTPMSDTHVDDGTSAVSRGKGSWYSQFQGRFSWVDKGDGDWNEDHTVYLGPNNALGVPDNRQGIALPTNGTLGKWFDVTAPNGRTLLLPQSDIGPASRTGRGIDISARAAESFGYSPSNFPTDSIFTWSPAAPPRGTENLTPKQQAVMYDPIQVIEPPSPGPIPPSPPAVLPAEIDMKVSGNVRIVINGTVVFVPD